MSLFQTESSIFAQDGDFSTEYSEDLYVERGEIVKKYAALLEPALQGRQPLDIFVDGEKGSGKTSTTKYLMGRLERDMKKVNREMTHVHICASDDSSSYQGLVKIVNGLRKKQGGDLLSLSGNSRDAVKQLLIEDLKKLSGVVYLVVDEADCISDLNVLLKDLSRLGEENELTNVQIGIIAIANDAGLLESLEARTSSTFQPKQITFPTYNSDTIKEILRVRSEVMFKEGVLPEKIVPLCASLGAQNGGDIRDAITLLKMAGENAQERIRLSDESGSEPQRVTTEDVQKAKQELLPTRYKKAIQGLNHNGKWIFFSVTLLECSGRAPARTSDVEAVFNKCDPHDSTLRTRRIREYLISLAERGLVFKDPQNNGRSSQNPGQYHEFELGASLAVSDALKLLMEVGFAEIDTEEMVTKACDKAVNNEVLTSTERDRLLNG